MESFHWLAYFVNYTLLLRGFSALLPRLLPALVVAYYTLCKCKAGRNPGTRVYRNPVAWTSFPDSILLLGPGNKACIFETRIPQDWHLDFLSGKNLKKKKHLGNQQNDVSEVASLQITRYQNRVHIKYSLLWFQELKVQWWCCVPDRIRYWDLRNGDVLCFLRVHVRIFRLLYLLTLHENINALLCTL